MINIYKNLKLFLNFLCFENNANFTSIFTIDRINPFNINTYQFYVVNNDYDSSKNKKINIIKYCYIESSFATLFEIVKNMVDEKYLGRSNYFLFERLFIWCELVFHEYALRHDEKFQLKGKEIKENNKKINNKEKLKYLYNYCNFDLSYEFPNDFNNFVKNIDESLSKIIKKRNDSVHVKKYESYGFQLNLDIQLLVILIYGTILKMAGTSEEDIHEAFFDLKIQYIGA